MGFSEIQKFLTTREVTTAQQVEEEAAIVATAAYIFGAYNTSFLFPFLIFTNITPTCIIHHYEFRGSLVPDLEDYSH